MKRKGRIHWGKGKPDLLKKGPSAQEKKTTARGGWEVGVPFFRSGKKGATFT